MEGPPPRRCARIAVFEVVLMSSVLALPWLLSSSSGESSQRKVARLKLEALEAKFDANPGSESLAADLQREYVHAGRDDEVQRVFEEHRPALSLKEAGREQMLRDQLAQSNETSARRSRARLPPSSSTSRPMTASPPGSTG